MSADLETLKSYRGRLSDTLASWRKGSVPACLKAHAERCDALAYAIASLDREIAQEERKPDVPCEQCGGAGCAFVATRISQPGRPPVFTVVAGAAACPVCRGTGRRP